MTKKVSKRKTKFNSNNTWTKVSPTQLRKESDWQTYKSSHYLIKTLPYAHRCPTIASSDLLGPTGHPELQIVRREILAFAQNKQHLSYLEAKYQFIRNVLEDDNYLNECCGGKWYKKNLPL
jgi:hypothetical protein